ncbi:MAG: hypothetical protein KF799_16185 [Bdellovibrionales bacterium]|nr:hypothetical protein [Bdellovibrionales bacterium]
MKAVVALLCIFSAAQSFAQDRSPQDEALWILNRLTGVRNPADSPVAAQMATLITNGDKKGAAALATQQPQFLSVTVKEMAAQMSTREETVAIPLNDFAAGIIGVTRDESDARELLHGNFYYTADPAKIAAVTPVIPNNLLTDILLSNLHYNALERSNLDVGATLLRVEGQQIPTSATTSIANPDPAGILTSHAFLAAHAVAGTNRRLVEYTFREFMCTEMIGMADTGAPDVRIGRDIERSPGGDPLKFQANCKGCHTVMDGFRGAFSKWDYVPTLSNAAQTPGGAIYVGNGVTAGNFQPRIDNNANDNAAGVMFKMNRPDFVQYSGGYILRDDSFINNAVRGVNATRFGWRGLAPDSSPLASATGGVHTFGRLIANSAQFSRCFAKRVFDQICKHDLSDSDKDALFASLGMEFEQNSYNLKKLFQAVAVHPRCRL